MAITAMNRKQADEIASAAMETLAELAEILGLDIKRESGKFNDKEFTFKCTFRIQAAEGEASVAEAEFKQFARMMGADPEWYGQSFNGSRGERLTITALNTRRPKTCIQLTDQNGRTFKCGIGYVKQMING